MTAKPKPARRKKRKTSQRAKGWWKRPDLAQMNRERWADPEYRARMDERNRRTAEMRKADPAKFTRTGVPNGMRRRTAKRLWAKAEQAADRFITMLEDNGDLPKPEFTIPDSDEAMAKAALKEAFTLAIVPGDLKIKTANIRTILEYTKSKPESKSKVTVETAEDWLKAAKADMETND